MLGQPRRTVSLAIRSREANLTPQYPHPSFNRADRVSSNAISTVLVNDQTPVPLGLRADGGGAVIAIGFDIGCRRHGRS